MQPDDASETPPSTSLIANLFSDMASMFFAAFGAQFADFCGAEQTALADPFAALTDLSSDL